MKVAKCKDCKNGKKRQMDIFYEDTRRFKGTATGMWCDLNYNWCRNVKKGKCSFEWR